MNLPEGQQAVTPYLIIKDAPGFLNFMQQVFGAKETYKQLREDNKTIRHAEIEVNGSKIMFADSTEEYPPSTAGLFVYVDDADHSHSKAVELGAKNIMSLSDQDYGRSGGVQDPYGNTWWITSVKIN